MPSCASGSSFFTTTTERDLAKTSFRGRWKSVVAPLGIVEGGDFVHDPAAQVEAFYRAWPALCGRRFLLFLARLHEKKGCDLLIEAFARVAQMAPEVDLVMAGRTTRECRRDWRTARGKWASPAGCIGRG